MWLAASAVMVGGGCDQVGITLDPVHRSAVEALGPEAPNVPEGPLHRPGQPCGVCHRENDEAPRFVFAGTIYRDPGSQVPVADVQVRFVDSEGTTFTTTTNCVGNFYVKPSELTPRSPTWVTVQITDLPYEMASPIHREVSCASCHFDPVSPVSAGHIFVTDDETALDAIPLRPCGPDDGVAR